jgi:hypothetical protein
MPATFYACHAKVSILPNDCLQSVYLIVMYAAGFPLLVVLHYIWKEDICGLYTD